VKCQKRLKVTRFYKKVDQRTSKNRMICPKMAYFACKSNTHVDQSKYCL